jgi:hypothetical protein
VGFVKSLNISEMQYVSADGHDECSLKPLGSEEAPLFYDHPLVDDRCQEFGDTFVAISKPNELMERVTRAASCLGRSIESGLVAYLKESTYAGPIGAFRKISAFAYQKSSGLRSKPSLSNFN